MATVVDTKSDTDRAGAFSPPARPAYFRKSLAFALYAVLGVLIFLLIIVSVTTLPVLFGYNTFIVYGGSMGDALPKGSVAVAERVDASVLEVGDIIAIGMDEESATLHRVTEIAVDGGERVAITQGDANETEDPEPVALAGEGARVSFYVPYAGYLLHWARSFEGQALLIGVPIVLLGVMLFNDMRREIFRSFGREGGEVEAVRVRASKVREQLPIAPPVAVTAQVFDEPSAGIDDCSHVPRGATAPSLGFDVMEDCSHAPRTHGISPVSVPIHAPVATSNERPPAPISQMSKNKTAAEPGAGTVWAAWPPREVALPVFIRRQLEPFQDDYVPTPSVARPERPRRAGPGLTGGPSLGRAA